MPTQPLSDIDNKIMGWMVDPVLSWADRAKRVNTLMRLEFENTDGLELDETLNCLRNAFTWIREYGSRRNAGDLENIFSSHPAWFEKDPCVRELVAKANARIDSGLVIPASGSFPSSASRILRFRKTNSLFYPDPSDEDVDRRSKSAEAKGKSVALSGEGGKPLGLQSLPGVDVDALFGFSAAGVPIDSPPRVRRAPRLVVRNLPTPSQEPSSSRLVIHLPRRAEVPLVSSETVVTPGAEISPAAVVTAEPAATSAMFVVCQDG
ncbi:hypothetical protein EUX98_g2813 [Antrodiella citrinella]|uniref:Uncharacterized protein n=1 Tax=Antrodiella citrinella TaxID=2447956 RepID=A0A4S4N102_9APHY|nr:hypothetical protein EUX98_g2813 [Antrodiella citrinella]